MIGHRGIVDLRVGDFRGQIVARVLPSIFQKVLKVREELSPCLGNRVSLGLARDIRIVGTEELAGQSMHHFAVFFRHAKDQHDHS